MKHNRTTNAVVDLNSCPDGQLSQEDQPSLADSLGFCNVHSRYSTWLALLLALLAMMVIGYGFDIDCRAPASTQGAHTEDPETIVVSGTASQQRDAVLANFAKYGNRLGESVGRMQ